MKGVIEVEEALDFGSGTVITAQTKLLCQHRISSKEQLLAFASVTEQEMNELCGKRKTLYNRIRRANDADQIEPISERSAASARGTMTEAERHAVPQRQSIRALLRELREENRKAEKERRQPDREPSLPKRRERQVGNAKAALSEDRQLGHRRTI